MVYYRLGIDIVAIYKYGQGICAEQKKSYWFKIWWSWGLGYTNSKFTIYVGRFLFLSQKLHFFCDAGCSFWYIFLIQEDFAIKINGGFIVEFKLDFFVIDFYFVRRGKKQENKTKRRRKGKA